jgi:hypothetical protein
VNEYVTRVAPFFQEMFNMTRENDLRFSIPRIPEEDEDLREDSSTSLARRGFEGLLLSIARDGDITSQNQQVLGHEVFECHCFFTAVPWVYFQLA